MKINNGFNKKIREEGLPCSKCICLPACRHKNYTNLMKCSIAYTFIHGHSFNYNDNHENRMRSLIFALGVDCIKHLGEELKY